VFRFTRTGILYGVFKVAGRTRWKCLDTEDITLARQRLAKEIGLSARIDWRQAGSVTVRQLVDHYDGNPMGLADGTMKIRRNLLAVFKRTWMHGLGIKASLVKPFMLKGWLAERRQEQNLKTAGVNNYIRLLHGVFKLAVDLGAVAENPAMGLKLLREESPERLTPSWQQAQTIITTVKRQASKDSLTAMLLLGLGQGELGNLQGEHIDLERGKITVRRQKTQRIFSIPIYPHAKSFVERLKVEGRIDPGKPVFTCTNPREALSLACRRLGYPQFSPRSFRRCFITRCLELGIDARVVASWQGHRDATLILRVYGNHINNDHHQRMANLLI
jgi:integrase